MPPDEIWRAYADADIYVQTPNVDNMPISVLEAYASGLPVVATAAGGVPAMVTDGETGLLTPLDDHAAIADGVLRLLDDPRLAARLTTRARAQCELYTWPAVRGLWVDAYRSALDRQTSFEAPRIAL